MTTLTVTATHDFRFDTLVGIDAITFSTSGFADASFGAPQFGGTGVSNSVHVTGDSHQNVIDVFLDLSFGVSPQSFSAAGWTFSHWSTAGGPDHVIIVGAEGADTIVGSSGIDDISGRGGADELAGGPGDDSFVYYHGSWIADGETVDGGPGIDELYIGSLDNYDFSHVALSSIEKLYFENEGATVTLAGDQIGTGAIGKVVGSNEHGDGLMHLLVRGETIDLSTLEFLRWKKGDTIELFGTNAITSNDLTGSPEADRITGAYGSSDFMHGRAGKDVLDGKTGTDTMTGNSGNDRFVFDTPLLFLPLFGGVLIPNLDHITDFEHKHDTIRLAQAIFTTLGTGHLSADAFHRGALAADAEDRVIYHRSDGKLFFDPDGTGPSAQSEFAILDNHAKLSHEEIVVFA